MDTFLSGIKGVLSKPRNKEEVDLNAVLADDSLTFLQLNDRRLNSIAALTYNIQSCDRIFSILENTISTSDNPHQVIHKSLLIIHSILLFGSEIAIDKCIKLVPFMTSLPDYNSALVKKNAFGISFSTGGTDYGVNVRNAAKALLPILMNDNNIRKARQEARQQNDNTLVPLGTDTVPVVANNNMQSNITFGQGMGTSIGQKFGMELVPGMYEGRPERYFDSHSDRRRHVISTGDHQSTRDKLAPSLLDLAFDDVANDAAKLPDAQFLPALERERELKRQLELQQQQLNQLQAMAALQQQQQHQQAQVNNLLNLSTPVMPSLMNTGPMSGMFTSYSAGGSQPTPMIATLSRPSTIPQSVNYNTYVPVQALQQPIPMSGPMGQMNMPMQMPCQNIGMMPSMGYHQPAHPMLNQQNNYAMQGYTHQSMQPQLMQQQAMQQQAIQQQAMQPLTMQAQAMYQSDPFSALGNNIGVMSTVPIRSGTSELTDDMPAYLPPPPPK